MDGESKGVINFIGPWEEMGEQGGAREKSEMVGKRKWNALKGAHTLCNLHHSTPR